ncbi:hypothetical protein [Streptomyces sp. NPDC051684]|uniref:hypothetical protein n=1 Tax=Streptomyces sp. NPDC051684 TaxID=3365670 RepID=UPI0037B587F6
MTGPPGTGRDRRPGRRVRGALRWTAYGMLAAELAVTGCVLTGVRPPPFVEALILTVFLVEAAALLVLYRRGGARAMRDVVPAKAWRLVGHELRVLGSYGLWVTRRRNGVPAGASAFAYARGQAVMMYALTFTCAVETFAMWALLHNWPLLHRVVLVLDVYTLVWILGLQAAAVTRPHVVSDDTVRVRRGALVDLRIPLERIAAVRRENRYSHEAKDGELNLDIGAQTSITLELAAPVRHFTFLGRPQEIHLVRLHAEEPDLLARTLRERIAGRPLTPA